MKEMGFITHEDERQKSNKTTQLYEVHYIKVSSKEIIPITFIFLIYSVDLN